MELLFGAAVREWEGTPRSFELSEALSMPGPHIRPGLDGDRVDYTCEEPQNPGHDEADNRLRKVRPAGRYRNVDRRYRRDVIHLIDPCGLQLTAER